ncbi:MAG: hypothetical protein WA700_10550 [Acidobacteriaceae bacterium]
MIERRILWEHSTSQQNQESVSSIQSIVRRFLRAPSSVAIEATAKRSAGHAGGYKSTIADTQVAGTARLRRESFSLFWSMNSA